MFVLKMKENQPTGCIQGIRLGRVREMTVFAGGGLYAIKVYCRSEHCRHWCEKEIAVIRFNTTLMGVLR